MPQPHQERWLPSGVLSHPRIKVRFKDGATTYLVRVENRLPAEDHATTGFFVFNPMMITPEIMSDAAMMK